MSRLYFYELLSIEKQALASRDSRNSIIQYSVSYQWVGDSFQASDIVNLKKDVESDLIQQKNARRPAERKYREGNKIIGTSAG